MPNTQNARHRATSRDSDLSPFYFTSTGIVSECPVLDFEAIEDDRVACEQDVKDDISYMMHLHERFNF